MAMTVDEVRSRERDALLGEYLNPLAQVPPYVAISNISDLTNTPSFLRAKYPLAIEPFPESDMTNGFVQHCPSLGYKFLWLRPEDKGHLSKYKAFLRRFYDIHNIPDCYEVDHLFNRARAIALNLSHVRMVLLGRRENRSHGAGYEKSRTAGRMGRSGNQRGIDEITLMKLCGIASPRKDRPLSSEMLAHVQRMGAMFGLPPLEIEANLRELMAVAAFRSDNSD